MNDDSDTPSETGPAVRSDISVLDMVLRAYAKGAADFSASQTVSNFTFDASPGLQQQIESERDAAHSRLFHDDSA